MNTLLETYLKNTTFKERNRNPREEGIIATLSDIIERKETFENLPKALSKINEFHLMFLDRSKFKSKEEHENTATLLTLCFSMMVFDKSLTKGGL